MNATFDSKIRMSIDPKIIDTMKELAPKVIEATRHKSNFISLRRFEFCLEDDTIDFVFHSSTDWSISRHIKSKDIWDHFDENGWSIKNVDDLIQITTFGKLSGDINREILPFLDDLRIQVDLLEDPIYCPICEHCGETGCCGFIGFLEKHVRNKTSCLYEEQILNDLEEFINDHE